MRALTGFCAALAVLLGGASASAAPPKVHSACKVLSKSAVGDAMKATLVSRKGGGFYVYNAGPPYPSGRLSSCQWRGDDAAHAGVLTLVVDGVHYTRRKRVGTIRNAAALTIGAKSDGGDWYRGLIDEASIVLG